MTRLFRASALAFVLALALSALVFPLGAKAAGEPNISLAKEAPKTALLGTTQKVTLRATNPAGEKRGYNLTFRDVLPAGVEYVAGSGSVAPRILHDAPVKGETTLLFENVADLSQNSEYKLTYEVRPEPSAFTVTDFYENEADAYVSRKARNKPKFNEKGEVIPGETSFKGFAEAKAKTTLTAVEIEKTEPSPEGELLRGVHEHQTVYTLHLRNNEVSPTNELSVDDYLPAGLEFLGCGTVDHTTDSPTSGTAEEYAGSGAIFPGNEPAAPRCLEPNLVETEEVDPDGPEGPRPFGVYTHVRWTGLGELAPGAEREIQYRAAVPIRRNTMSWTGAKPTGASLGQAANLDNNAGPETVDEEPLVNYSTVHGKFNGTVEVEDADELLRTAEDLAIQKSVDSDEIGEGQISHWTFHLESSEYRYVNNVRIEDNLPNGLCPLGKVNYENPIQTQEECDPVAGEEPTAEYTSVAEQLTGGFIMKWDQSTVPALAQMAPSTEVTITFPTRTRVFYQQNFEDAAPILTGDSWTNDVSTLGQDFARCAPADPTCTKGQPKIFTQEPEGEDDTDVSSASQEAGGVEIDKTVREDTGGLVPADCEGTYVDGKAAPLPSYAPGDKICWQLRVDFASDLYAGTPAVTDFLPPNEKFLSGSAAEVKPPNTVESTFDETEAAGGALEWELGSSVESGSKVWEWRFATEMGTSLESRPEDITGNLMKFVYSNTEGKTFPLRDRAEIEREEPELKLLKGVFSVGGVPAGGNGPNQNATGAHGGEVVKYRLDLENAGNLVAENIEMWDRLPAGIECSDLVGGSISDGGTCEAGNIIVGNGLTVAKEATLPSVTYEVTLPADVAPNQTYVNEAGVRTFQSPTNTGVPFDYYPAENIDPVFEGEHTPNTGKIKDPATVSTAAASLAKARETTVVQSGNNGPEQATIGEGVIYKLTASVPEGTVLFGSPTIVDPLGSRLALVPGTVKGKVNGAAIPTGGFTVAEEAGNPVLRFPATYTNAEGSGADTIVLEFEAKVTDVAANRRVGGEFLVNEGTFTYKDQGGATKNLPATASTTIVEPNVAIGKSHAGGKTVKPGQIVEYTVTAQNPNGARVSTANESVVLDTVPAGMTPVNGETAVVDGGVVNPDGGTWNEGTRTITWAIAELAPAASKALHYSLRVNEPANAGSVFKNKATITTTSLPGAVPGERTSASASHAGYEAKAEDEATLNDATLEKEVAAPKGTTIGSPLTYTLKLKLPPQITYYDLTVEDQLPKGVAYDATTGITCAPACPEVQAAGQALTPKASAGSQLLGWYFGQVEPAGVERTVTITYTAHIAKDLEAGVPVVAKAKLANKAIGLYSGEAKLAKPPTEPPARGEFTNKTNEPTQEVEVDEPHLVIAKAETGASAAPKTQPGDKYTYTLTVTNEGDSAAYDVVVKDDNPQGVLRSVDPTGAGNEGSAFLVAGWQAGDPLEWTIPGPIAVGGTVHLQYTAALAPSAELHQGDAIENVADIPVYFGAPEAQRTEEGPGRFRAYEEDPTDTVTLETALPQLQLKKTVGPEALPETEAQIGQPLAWHLEVKNTSTVATLKGADIVDALPKGWEYVPGSTTGVVTTNPGRVINGAEEEELTWTNVADLAPGASVTLNFNAVPTLALALTPGIYTNHAVVTGEDSSGATASAEGPYEAAAEAKANLKTPGLELTKTPDVPGPGSDAVAGEPSAYTLEIVNGGGAVATDVEVTDTLGAGNDYTAGSATATPPTGFAETAVEPLGGGVTRVKWTIAQIPVGGTVLVHIPVGLAASIPDGTTLVDNATVKSAQESTPVGDEGSLLVKRQTDIAIEKKEARATLNAGEGETYELHVENLGPSDATGVVATDTLPANVKVISAPGCTEAAGVLTCAIGDLALGESRDFTVQTQVLAAATGTVVNEADVTSTTEDPEPANDHDETTANLTTEAAVTIQKSGPAAPVLLGSTFAYTLEVENAGPSDALAVAVEDALPPEVDALSVETDTPGCEPAAAIVECELGTMVPGQVATIHVTVKAIGIPAGGAPVVNTATVGSPTDPTPDESTAETTVLPAADLAIVKTGPATVPADGEVTYGLHVENHGPSDGTEVHVTDPLPAGTQFVSAGEGCAANAGTVECMVGELKVGEARDYQVTVKVPLALAGQPLTNTATVGGHEADPESHNDSSTVTTTVGPAADLSIAKTMGTAQAGKPLAYTLAITNHGPSASSAVTVTDTLPAGTTFNSAAPSQGACAAAGQVVTCQLGALAAGGSAQVGITVDVAASATGSLRNVATVEGPEPDPNKANNEGAVEGPVGPADPTDPNLKVVKTADTSTPEVGVPFDYHVAITNLNGGEAKNVKLTDTLNGPVKVLSVEAEGGNCSAAGSKITCQIPSIPVGKTVLVTYAVVAEAVGPLSNTASAQAKNGEKNPANNQGHYGVKAKKAEGGHFSLTKTADRKVVGGGKKVGFTITLRNGKTALTDARVCDRLPSALVFVKAPGASFERGEACWTKSYVAPHKVLRFHLIARAVKGYVKHRARNLATATAAGGEKASAAAVVRIKPAFGGKPGGVTG